MPKIDKILLDSYITKIDGTLSEQLDEILHAPEFQTLESTWHVLKYLVERTDFKSNIRIDLINIDKESLRDGEGREIDFRNTIIFMTANLGSELMMEFTTPEEARLAVEPVLSNHFSPAFEVLDFIVEHAYHPDRGARSLNHLIEQQIEPSIARSILIYMTQDIMPKKAVLLIDEQGVLQCEF